MTRTVHTDEIGPGDTVEVWDDQGLQCRATVDCWDGNLWVVTDQLNGGVCRIPESYLTKIEE